MREPAEVDEAASAAMWTDPRFGGVGRALMTGFEIGRCGVLGRGRGGALEL